MRELWYCMDIKFINHIPIWIHIILLQNWKCLLVNKQPVLGWAMKLLCQTWFRGESADVSETELFFGNIILKEEKEDNEKSINSWFK